MIKQCVLSHQFLSSPFPASPAQDHTDRAYTFVAGKTYVGTGYKKTEMQAKQPRAAGGTHEHKDCGYGSRKYCIATGFKSLTIDKVRDSAYFKYDIDGKEPCNNVDHVRVAGK